MHLDIQGRGFCLTNAVKDHTGRRLAVGPGRSFHHVSRVAVRLTDINGPLGGIDKRCRTRVRPGSALILGAGRFQIQSGNRNLPQTGGHHDQ